MAPRAAIGERRRVPSKRMRFAHALGRTALARVGAAASPAPPGERSTFPPSPPPPPLPPLRPRLPAPPAAARGAARWSRAGRWVRSPLARSARAGRCSVARGRQGRVCRAYALGVGRGRRAILRPTVGARARARAPLRTPRAAIHRSPASSHRRTRRRPYLVQGPTARRSRWQPPCARQGPAPSAPAGCCARPMRARPVCPRRRPAPFAREPRTHSANGARRR